MDMVSTWIAECAFLGSGFLYVYTIERRPVKRKRSLVIFAIFLIACGIRNYWLEGLGLWLMPLSVGVGFLFLVAILRMGRRVSWFAAIYYAVWSVITWQLLLELCHVIRAAGMRDGGVYYWIVQLLVFTGGYLLVAHTIGRALAEEGQKHIGPRQLALTLLMFIAFALVTMMPGRTLSGAFDQRWAAIYMTQLLIAMALYLENELFKKSEMRKELEMVNLILLKEKEQYQLSRENIALINQKVHDLKHQIRAIRSASQKDIDQYLKEVEDSVSIYEAIIKTGNEVLDTILTEKSLYCKDRGITVSCMADGSQLGFINTIDLYAILGNAIDNAIEAVEKLEEEKKQIDILIYRKHQFLEISVINPLCGKLSFEDELPVSTKGNRSRHGFGLKSIRYILDKYGGVLSIKEEDGCFTLLMLIPIPASAQGRQAQQSV